MFRVKVSVRDKRLSPSDLPYWNKTLMNLQGDKDNLLDVIREYTLVKGDVNEWAQSKGHKFKNLIISIEQV